MPTDPSSSGPQRRASSDLRPLTPVKWYAQAEQFLMASNFLEKRTHQESFWAVVPLVCCRALATECYLKCVLALDGIDFRYKHSFKSLFYRLPIELRNRLAREWEVGAKKLPATPPGLPASYLTPRKLSKALELSGDAFEQVRYRSGETESQCSASHG